LHLAQLAFAFCKFFFAGERHGLLPALLAETLRRVEEFPPQSLFDVHDALHYFGALPRSPTTIERCLGNHYEELVARMETFARSCADGPPPAAQVAAYRQAIEKRDVVTLGVHHTVAFLRHYHLLCPDDDPFVKDGRRQIKEWRADAAAKDPTSRSVFHRAQCAWQLGCQESADALADGVITEEEAAHIASLEADILNSPHDPIHMQNNVLQELMQNFIMTLVYRSMHRSLVSNVQRIGISLIL